MLIAFLAMACFRGQRNHVFMQSLWEMGLQSKWCGVRFFEFILFSEVRYIGHFRVAGLPRRMQSRQMRVGFFQIYGDSGRELKVCHIFLISGL